MGRHSDCHLAPVEVTITCRYHWQADRLTSMFMSRFRRCHVDGKPRRDPYVPERLHLSGWDPGYLDDLALVELGEKQYTVRAVGYGHGDRRMPVVSLSTDYSCPQLRTICASLDVRAPSRPMRGVDFLHGWLEQEHREKVAVVS